MSCDVAAAAFLFLAAAGPSPSATMTRPPEVSVAKEPLYADIITRAAHLKAEVEAFRKEGKGPGAFTLPKFDAFEAQIGELSALDMKGHLDLAARGTDGDLKCILRGISQDLPKRLAEVKAATDWKAQETALKEMSYLLNDNVEVITAPPAPPV